MLSPSFPVSKVYGCDCGVKRTSLAQSAKGRIPCPCSLPILFGLRWRLVSSPSFLRFVGKMLRTWKLLCVVLPVLVSVIVLADECAGLGVAHVLFGS